MKTKEQLRDYFDRELLPILRRYENIRISLLRKVVYTAVFLVSVALTLILFIVLSTGHFFGVLMVVVGIAGLWDIIFKYYTASYQFFYKQEIIDRLVKFINPDFLYTPDKYIEKSFYVSSQLYTEDCNSYSGSDLIEGQYDKTQFAFSELQTQFIVRDTKSSKKRTIFKGLFFMADFNKDFMGYTLVLPDYSQKYFGNIAQTLQGLSSKGKLVKLENVEFENEFVVYSNDQVEARYILTPALMQRILVFRKKTAKRVRISFTLTKVFVAVENKGEMFKTSLFKSLLDFNPIAEYYDNIALAVGIIDDLNLNQRIWTKQ